MSYSKLHNPIRSDEGRSGAVQAVLFQTGPITWQETKQGSIIFSGEAASFHDWEFRTRMKMMGCTDPSKYAENMSKIMDGLRGEAFTLAMEIGTKKLCEQGEEAWDEQLYDADDNETELIHHPAVESGLDLLIAAVRKSVFPQTTHEAKELFRQYMKPGGYLSRQRGESMEQFISRRGRAWKLVKKLDDQIIH